MRGEGGSEGAEESGADYYNYAMHGHGLRRLTYIYVIIIERKGLGLWMLQL